MRIEVLVDAENPQIYPLSQSKIIIGSHESCDVILSSKGISRKHLIIQNEGESFYVIDQGSTNGSYINEERLVPGRRTEFTSFFPVRLGDSVLISLISDEDAAGSGMIETPLAEKKEKESTRSEVSTRMLSLKDLSPGATEKLVKRNKQDPSSRKRAPVKAKKGSQEKARSNVVLMFAVSLVGLAIYFNLYMKEEEIPEVAPKSAAAAVTPAKVIPVQVKESKLVNEEDLIPKEKLMGMIDEIKCTTDIEKLVCGSIFGASGANWGAVQIGTSLTVVLDGTAYLEKARRVARPPAEGMTSEKVDEYEREIKDLALLFFLEEAIHVPIDANALADYKLTFAFFDGPEKKFAFAVAFLPKSLRELKQMLNPAHTFRAQRYGIVVVKFIRDYYRLY